MQSSCVDRLTTLAIAFLPQMGCAARLAPELQKALLPEGATAAVPGVGVLSAEARRSSKLAETARWSKGSRGWKIRRLMPKYGNRLNHNVYRSAISAYTLAVRQYPERSTDV